MRTTVTLASDVAVAVERLQRERGRGVSDAVNELIRRGLTSPSSRKPFQQASSVMGEPSVPVDDVAGLLEILDGPGST